MSALSALLGKAKTLLADPTFEGELMSLVAEIVTAHPTPTTIAEQIAGAVGTAIVNNNPTNALALLTGTAGEDIAARGAAGLPVTAGNVASDVLSVVESQAAPTS